jgi:hypothetical protein
MTKSKLYLVASVGCYIRLLHLIKCEIDLEGGGGVEWILLAQDRDWCQALVNTVMNLRVWRQGVSELFVQFLSILNFEGFLYCILPLVLKSGNIVH